MINIQSISNIKLHLLICIEFRNIPKIDKEVMEECYCFVIEFMGGDYVHFE